MRIQQMSLESCLILSSRVIWFGSKWRIPLFVKLITDGLINIIISSHLDIMWRALS